MIMEVTKMVAPRKGRFAWDLPATLLLSREYSRYALQACLAIYIAPKMIPALNGTSNTAFPMMRPNASWLPATAAEIQVPTRFTKYVALMPKKAMAAGRAN